MPRSSTRERKARGVCTYCAKREPQRGRVTCAPCSKLHSWLRSQKHQQLRAAVLDAYGRRCANPACPDPTANLTVDHADGRGAEHWGANSIRNTYQFYRWLVRHNFPPGFQILCLSCNASKGARAELVIEPVLRQATLFDGDAS